LLLGVGLLGITVYLVDWSAVYRVVVASRGEWILAALGVMLTTLALKLLRWGSLLRGYGVRIGWLSLGRAFFTGQAANILLPVRGGEAVRLGIAIAGRPDQWEVLAASLSLEKILDFLALLLASLWVWNSSAGRGLLGQNSIPWISAAILFLLLALVPLWKIARPLLARSSHKTAARLLASGDRVGRYLRWISRPRRLLAYAAQTALIWVLMLLTNLCVMRSVSLPADFAASAAVLVLIYLGLAPALMPGNLGPFLLLAGLGLSAYGYPPSPAFAFALLLHLIVTLPPLLLSAGLYLAGRVQKFNISNEK